MEQRFSPARHQALSESESNLNEGSCIQLATFGAGCFWHTEAAFSGLAGVLETSVGYMGGHFAQPSYLDVLSRITGHAEVAQVKFDSSMLAYEQLLDIFWSCHDPTTLNRQGPDRGEQYRSVIFYHTEAQHQAARSSKQAVDASERYGDPIVTDIQPAGDYWLATDDHQQYLAKRRRQA